MELVKQTNTGSGGKLFTGIFSAKVIAINPDRAAVAEMYNSTVDPEKKELEYEGKSKDGDEQIQIVPWVEITSSEFTGQKFRIPYYITDKLMIWPTSKKLQFVSQTGDNGSADSLENLQDWFTHFQDFKSKENTADKIVRQGLSGEADWYKFLKPWLSNVKFSDPATNILFDSKKLFRNVDKYITDEYRALLKLSKEDSLTGEIVILAYVQTKEKDGQLVHQQKFWPEILGRQVKDGSRYSPTMQVVNSAVSTGNWKGGLEKWHKQITDVEHGCKGSYTMGLLTEFDAATFQQSTNNTFIPATDIIADTDY